MKVKRSLSAILAVVMLVAVMCSGASAATLSAPTYRLDPNYQPERFGGIIPAEVMRATNALDPDKECNMPYNNGSGTTGEVAFSFTTGANDTTIKWEIDWSQREIDDVYYWQLWRQNGDGIPDSKVGTERQSSFNAGVIYENLIGNTNYYLKVSSKDVPKRGASCLYDFELS